MMTPALKDARSRHEAWLAAGGPAYPPSVNKAGEEGTDGMSLRDAFATDAAAAILTRESSRYQKKEAIANEAYGMADAMLERRKIGVE
jgi:hypothetical protein